MEVYVEYKPCYKTIRDSKNYPEMGYYIIPSIIHFVDGKSNCSMYLTNDCKFVYGFYYSMITKFRVTNISSKPIKYKDDKVAHYKKIQKQIDELKEEQRRILKGK